MAQIDFYLANSKEKMQKAFNLVFREYKKDGYVNADAKPEIPGYNFLPTSATFIAKFSNEIIGTVTIIGDGERGLPMEMIYRQEAEKIRKNGKKIAEIGQLAIKRDLKDVPQKEIQLAVLLPLFKLVYFYAKIKGIEKLCVSINPKHESFYDSIGFENIGGLKYYPFFNNNAPALAKILDIGQNPEELREKSFIFEEILKNPLTKKDFQRGEAGEIIFSQKV